MDTDNAPRHDYVGVRPDTRRGTVNHEHERTVSLETLRQVDVVRCIHFVDTVDLDVLKLRVGLTRISGLYPERVEDLRTALAHGFGPVANIPDWETLAERMSDLSWRRLRPGDARVLLIEDAYALWSRWPLEAGKLVEVWAPCAVKHAQNEVAFHLIFEFNDLSPAYSKTN
jgi:hypothetical protein